MTKTNITTAYQKLLELIKSKHNYEIIRDGFIAVCNINNVISIEYYDSKWGVHYRYKDRRFHTYFDEFITLAEAEKKRKKLKNTYIKGEIADCKKGIRELNKELAKWQKKLSTN